MKKKGLMIGMVLSLAVCLCLALFCACGKTTDTGDTSQREIYNAYVAYATAAGDDVLSYEEWLDSIRGKDGKDGLNGKDGKDGSDGKDGKDGSDGKSAYDIWLENGHSGTESDFLNWLKGEKGDTGAQGLQGQKGEDGTDGKDGKDGQDGTNGQDGKSAYDIWKENGHSGTEAEFLEWLKGEQGEKGQDGQNGKDGVNGTDGKDGVNGQDGKDGADGKDGVDGKDGKDGLSAFDIFKKYYPFYEGSEEEWIADLVNGNLTIYKVTFKSEVAEDIVRRVFTGRDLTDIPEVPEKEGQASAKWDREDFTNITEDIEVHAVYTMKQLTVTFHNEYTEEEDETRTVEYGQAFEDVPTVTPKAGQLAYWDVKDLSRITEDMTVNAVYETIGLAYTLINNQQEYRVSAGTMNTEAEELFIPAVHDDKPVTVIAENAFNAVYPNDYKFKLAHLPESITEIRNYAFASCGQLQNIKIPSKVTEIGEYAFAFCKQLTAIEMPTVIKIGQSTFTKCEMLSHINIPQVTEIVRYAFSGCKNLSTVEMPNVTEIGDGVFSDCTTLEHLEIPSGVTYIYSELFSGCTSLKYVILPSEITYIGRGIFSDCTVFEAIYFKGSKEAWSALNKSSAGAVFNDAKVYYYADPMPEENEGDYWHYDVDKVTPVVWKKQS